MAETFKSFRFEGGIVTAISSLAPTDIQPSNIRSLFLSKSSVEARDDLCLLLNRSRTNMLQDLVLRWQSFLHAPRVIDRLIVVCNQKRDSESPLFGSQDMPLKPIRPLSVAVNVTQMGPADVPKFGWQRARTAETSRTEVMAMAAKSSGGVGRQLSTLQPMHPNHTVKLDHSHKIQCSQVVWDTAQRDAFFRMYERQNDTKENSMDIIASKNTQDK
ncbi:hypothetical protein K435DRAFT_917892 [Dendrothele bispora CBS 962.96]|uniref:Uncharacterized protein n=1 Tax=Dendrothele bispora (strain CBS 962.96) TaxID=1314807 RepID=A0A4S8MJ33_DENBC|nr:hypothetical protein K435DRAFT_917892 [Dendrothele bispora CBS 962.96]